MMMLQLTKMAAAGVNVAPDKDTMSSFTSGELGEKFGVSTRGMYGFIQNQAEGLVKSTKILDGKIVVWTALPYIGTEEATKQTIHGPEIRGKAKTDASKAWGANCLHRDCDTKYVAKNSANFWSQSTLPDCLEDDELEIVEGDDPLTSKGLVRFVALLDEANAKAKEAI